jgi:hypothetical protein
MPPDAQHDCLWALASCRQIDGANWFAARERKCSGGCDLCAQAGRTSRQARGDPRPSGTSVIDGSRPQQVQPHARSQVGRFVDHDEDSSKPDMLINRLSSGATPADLPARGSVSSRHSGADSAVSARSEAPARCPVVECQNRSLNGTSQKTVVMMKRVDVTDSGGSSG